MPSLPKFLVASCLFQALRVGLLLGLGDAAGQAAAALPDPSLEAKAAALLQERCLQCHDANKQKGGLRLDDRARALEGGEHGAALKPGRSSQSLLMERVKSTDPDLRMPPKGAALGTAEVALLAQWIDAGAAFDPKLAQSGADPRLKHWSAQPLRVTDQVGGPAALDALVRAELDKHGLKPSAAADRRSLIRRLSVDLHGLLPSPERVLAFEQDRDPRAYERLVDEMLASPHYGERWARHWLDIAHYADTHGFERDQIRAQAWRYRDYVIDSLNADQPYDRFLIEQIAGDVLSPEDPQAVIATGFLAAGPWDFVGQVETRSAMQKRAARALDLDDMVAQVITSTMGVTVHCARCHDHKLDPIAQREYYQLWAVFAGVRRGERDVSPKAAAEFAAAKSRLERQAQQLRGQVAALSGEGLSLAGLLPEASGIDLRRGMVTRDKLGYHRDIQTNRLQKVDGLPGIKWVFVPDGRTALKLDHKLEVKGLAAGSGHSWDAIANRPLNAQQSTTLGAVDYNSKGHRLLAMHANGGITFDLPALRLQSGHRAMRLSGVLGFGASAQAAATVADFRVYVDGRLAFERLKMRKDETAVLEVAIAETARTLSLVATDGGDGISSDLLFLGDPQLLADEPERTLSLQQREQLAQRRRQLHEVEQELKSLAQPAKVYAVLPEQALPAVRVQRRGNPEDEGAEVQPGGFSWAAHAPALFGDASLSEGQRRLKLARWIADARNPFTARVMVNRLWHHHFGQGLVATPSDFGLGGGKPSHPALLDALASAFIRSGWSLKAMHKLIVMSQTYQQQSGGSGPGFEGARSLDAQNRLLWRQNPRRLDAESLRDVVLEVSGNLNLQRGGPGFRDFRYTEAYAPIYEYITADEPALWRRSIYRFVVRTTPHRFMSTLDCPDPANLTPVRNQTTTALQALALSNNDFMLRQARALAKRLEREQSGLEAQIQRAFALCFQRQPLVDELAAAISLSRAQGLLPLCRMLLNANEFIYLD